MGKNLYTYLFDLYKDKARYCVMFISKYYKEKLWASHERKAIQERIFTEFDSEYLLPVRLDDTTIDGVGKTIGYVENKTFVFDESVNMNDVKKCVNIINDRMKGTAISELSDKMEIVKPLIQTLIQSNDAIYRAFAEAFLKFTSDRIAFYGKENLLDQPEFTSDLSKFKKLLEFIDSPSKMRDIIDSDESLDVHIGKDEEGNGFDDVSFVTKKISIGNDNEGTITLVGPTRMDYDRIVNALEYLAKKIDEIYNKESERKEQSDEG